MGDDASIANPYKWGRTNVRQFSEAGAREIDRLDADSKFFRSVTVVLAILAGVSYAQDFPLWIRWASAGMMVLSFWRFADLRWKSVETACLHYVVLQGIRPSPEASPAATGNTQGQTP